MQQYRKTTDPLLIANGIEVIKDDDARHQIAMNGYHFVSDFPDDRVAFMGMEKIFLESFDIAKYPVKKDSAITALLK